MRIFFGIALKEHDKKAIRSIVNADPKLFEACRMTLWENYHLTLKFIGEVPPDELSEYLEILSALKLPNKPMKIQLDRLGTFIKRKGNVVWAGSRRPSKKLAALVAAFEEDLQEGPYIPHITVARKCHGRIEREFEPIQLIIDNVTLFESKRVDDVLRYVPIETRKFK